MAVVTEQDLAAKEPLKLGVATDSLAHHVVLPRMYPPQGYHTPVMPQNKCRGNLNGKEMSRALDH
eukprot:8739666-Pyramimonas_sp.AAC.1